MGGGQSLPRLISDERLAEQRVGSGMESLRRVRILAHHSQSERAFGGFTFPGSVQQNAGFGLLIPVDNDDLKRLICDSFSGVDGIRAEFGLEAQTGENLAKYRGRLLIGGKYEAAKRHASSG